MTIDSLVVTLIYLCIPWALIELGSQLLRHYSNRARSAILGDGRRLITSAATRERDSERKTWISRGPLWIKIETARFNTLPSRLLKHLDRLWLHRENHNGSNRRRPDGTNQYKDGIRESRKESSTVQRYLELFYDGGTVFAGLAFFGSILFLIWGAFDLIGQIAELGVSASSESVAAIKKRGIEEFANTTPINSRWAPSLVPLVPGLTLPLSHIVPLTLALSFTQLVHEAGHAICGSLHSWTPLRMGLILLFPCIPGAFVILPQEAIESEEGDESKGSSNEYMDNMERKRLRTVSAGVWHNALTALTLALLIFSGLSGLLHRMMWKEVDGMRVELVEATSPLLQHMPRGTMITQLNDFDLTSSVTSFTRKASDTIAAWETYLLDDGASKAEPLGWCVPSSIWSARSTLCCDALGSNETMQDHGQDSLCFAVLNAASPSSAGRCFNPVNLIQARGEKKERCSGSCLDDQNGQAKTCIIPDMREQLIRITINQQGELNQTRVVLFQGSPKSIFSALTVSPFHFRIKWFHLPYHAYRWWTLLISYIFDLSLAMALLNMLPLPSLDGDVYFQFILKVVISRFNLGHHYTANIQDDDGDEEENLNGIELGARVTSRPDSPTQFRRASRFTSDSSSFPHQQHQRRSATISTKTTTTHGTMNNRALAKVHQRFQWFTVFLAVFVFGGSILLHVVKESAE